LIELKNISFQMLTFHLAGDAGSIHLGSRERRILDEKQVSDEMRKAASRGFISITSVAENAQPDPVVESPDNEHMEPRPSKRRTR